MSSTKKNLRSKATADAIAEAITDEGKVRNDDKLLSALEDLIDKKLGTKQSYDELLQINATLIEQNKKLLERVEALEAKLSSQVTVSDLVAEIIETVSPDPPSAATSVPEPAPEHRKQMKCLLISDSMMRHVDVMEDTMKVFLPGAQCEEIYWRFMELNEDYVFSEIIVSVGTNMIKDSSWYMEEVAIEIQNLLTAMNNLTPEFTRVTYAQVLPIRGGERDKYGYIERINYLNSELDDFTRQANMGFINYQEHGTIFSDKYIFNIICQDGTHLNRHGIKLVSWYIKRHLIYNGIYLDQRD